MLATARRPHAVAFLALFAATTCLTPTPFGTESDENDLNAKNVARLAESSVDGNQLQLVALGDTHAEYDELVRAVRSINRGNHPDMVIHLGDQTNQGLLQEYEWERSVLAELEVPLVLTLGNHDALGSGEAIYRHMYGPLNYTFSHRGYRFVSFNSNTLEFPDSAPDREWLSNAVLTANEPRGVIVFTHHSPETTDAPDDVLEYYRELLQSGRIVLWFHGHSGDFGVSRIEGVPVVSTSNFHETYNLARVTSQGRDFAFERCRFDECTPVEVEAEPPAAVVP